MPHDVHEAKVPLDTVITTLDQKDVITSIVAKRCRRPAGVRNGALHAQWDTVTLDDVDTVLRPTRELLSSHLAEVGAHLAVTPNQCLAAPPLPCHTAPMDNLPSGCSSAELRRYRRCYWRTVAASVDTLKQRAGEAPSAATSPDEPENEQHAVASAHDLRGNVRMTGPPLTTLPGTAEGGTRRRCVESYRSNPACAVAFWKPNCRSHLHGHRRRFDPCQSSPNTA